MCGIAGLFNPDGLGADAKSALGQMSAAIAHRGPDGDGIWIDPGGLAALAHRRLAIIDLTPSGHQPMVSASGRYVLSFNGEIYNFLDLRHRLETSGAVTQWRGRSDTEVLLAAIETWGLGDALKQAKGMFALGLWDRHAQTLALARDAVGEKPLYVGMLGKTVAFGSELKAVMAHPAWQGDIDHDAVAQCLRHGYICAPQTLWQNVRKVRPGTFLTLSAQNRNPHDAPETCYWDMYEQADQARKNRFRGDADDAVVELDRLLQAAISRQMIADVPVGAFLSGGIDSSTIAAVMQTVAGKRVQSFSLGFHEKGANEAEFAKAVAGHLGLDHHEIYLSGDDARDLIADMPAVYDEPFADSSQLATCLIAQFTRQNVTVALSGDAGDEIFGGYNRYHRARRLWDGTPSAAFRRWAEKTGIAILDGAVLAPAHRIGLADIFGRNVTTTRLQLERRHTLLQADTPVHGYETLFTTLNVAHRLVPGARPICEPLLDRLSQHKDWSVLEQASFLDMMRYLPDDILVKVDRAAMAVGLETRIPFLDTDILNFAFSLPDAIKLQNGEAKGVLKGVLARYVPRHLWDRPKQGFGIPMARWLKGPLFELASDLFSRESVIRTGVLDPDLVAAIWTDFQHNAKLRPKIVWTLFVTQLFLHRIMSRGV